MAGTEEEGVCSFEWDDDSKLYFHASTGFYHDPNAGWYYSSRDGMYYTFENGSYVPMECNEGKESEADHCTNIVSHEPIIEEPLGMADDVPCDRSENECRPSEWLEETLIGLYLSGYSNSQANANGEMETLETSDASCEEDNWQAQYGQVVRSADEDLPSCSFVELWDWELVRETVKKEHQVARLIGKLVRPSSKLHPSMPSGGSHFKTGPIREVHRDLVRVTSGKVYRLRTPNAKYLASLSTYDSSNPTEGWDFPLLSSDIIDSSSIRLDQAYGSDVSDAVCCDTSSSYHAQASLTSDKSNAPAYKDRAAARRSLHGAHSIGPGMRNISTDFDEVGSSEYFSGEAAAMEAMHASFGSGSYARKILEGMGWKHGEALGSTNKGILEPLQVTGNIGFAGLGWNNARS